jgi:hypothetical protein
LKKPAQFYGPLRVKSAEFKMNGGGKCPGCSFADTRWYITLSGPSATRGLLILVEPFFGRVTSISESGDAESPGVLSQPLSLITSRSRAGAQSTYLLVVGDQGKNNGPGQ